MAIKQFVLTDENKELTPEQVKDVEEACARPVAYDPDFPPFTEEQLISFKKISDIREENKKRNRKQTVSLRLSPSALKKARSLGKGYTGLLSLIVERALEDPEITKKLLS